MEILAAQVTAENFPKHGAEAKNNLVHSKGPRVYKDAHPGGQNGNPGLHRFLQEHPTENGERRITELVRSIPRTAFPDEPLRVVVYRMAESGLTRLPVVERNDPSKLVGLVSLDDLLKARVRNPDAERRRERALTVRQFFGSG